MTNALQSKNDRPARGRIGKTTGNAPGQESLSTSTRHTNSLSTAAVGTTIQLGVVACNGVRASQEGLLRRETPRPNVSELDQSMYPRELRP